MKRKIMRNLRTLETEKMVNSKNDYQEIINAIAKVYIDIDIDVYIQIAGDASKFWNVNCFEYKLYNYKCILLLYRAV